MKNDSVCPVCGKEHKKSLVQKENVLKIKGINVKYDAEYYVCENVKGEDGHYCNGKQLEKNMLNARNTYRKKIGLLTSDEIIEIRNRYTLSQVELARLMDVGDVTIARYETKAIQEPIYDNSLKKLRDYPFETLRMLEKNKHKFSDKRYEEIKNKIIQLQFLYGAENDSRDKLNNEYFIFQSNCMFKNIIYPDIDLIEKIISYIAFRSEDLLKTMLMKFLWYVDKTYFEKHSKILTNLIYIHEKYGALPVGHYEIIGLNNVKKQVETHLDSIVYHILPNEKLDFTSLDREIINIIDSVLNKFENMNTNQIVEYMYNEKEYKCTKMYEVMKFSTFDSK